MKSIQAPHLRRPKIAVSSFGINFVHLKIPWVTAWWSAAFPGLGQILLCQYVKGFALFLLEVIINTQANLNMAIIYSFTGRFNDAIAIINYDWVLIYSTVYVYSIWDGYSRTVELNKVAILADRLESPIPAARISLWEINVLDKRSPVAAAFWAAMIPGIGHLYTHRYIAGIYILIWVVVFVYKSHISKAVHFSLLGDFSSAVAIAAPQWLLFLPSLFGFAIYDSYVSAVEYNRLFDTEQKRFLVYNYQAYRQSPIEKKQCCVFSTFEHSMDIELALSDLIKHGIPKNQIMAVPLNKRIKEIALYDTIHRADGVSSIDGAAILGTACMVLGTVYGFIWHGGPIIWGLIGLIGGGAVGFIADYTIAKKNRKKAILSPKGEVVVIVDCEKDQTPIVEKILWDNAALGVSIVGRGDHN